jgi:hypothetical protein
MHIVLTNESSVKIRGADCGIEAIMLGVITSIGGFLFGYDTVCFDTFTAIHPNIF